jgi:hypothetical protein
MMLHHPDILRNIVKDAIASPTKTEPSFISRGAIAPSGATALC